MKKKGVSRDPLCSYRRGGVNLAGDLARQYLPCFGTRGRQDQREGSRSGGTELAAWFPIRQIGVVQDLQGFLPSVGVL